MVKTHASGDHGDLGFHLTIPDLYLSFGIRMYQVVHGFTWFFAVLPVSVKPIKSNQVQSSPITFAELN